MNEPSSSHAAAPLVRGSILEVYYPYQGAEHRASIYIASFPQIAYLWPTMLAFLIGAVLQSLSLMDPVSAGWLAVSVFCSNVVVLVQDFDRRRFIIVFLLLLCSGMGLWIMSLYGFSVLKSLADAVLGLRPELNSDALGVMGGSLLILMLWGLTLPLFDHWKFENNEFIHYSLPLGKDMSIARAGLTVYKEIPDVLEWILSGGGGTLVIRRDTQVLASIPNVPFLGRRMRTLEHMLSETRVTVVSETPVSGSPE